MIARVPIRRVSPAISGALLLAALGLALCGLGLAVSPLRVGAAWLAAFAFALGFPTGALTLAAFDRLVPSPASPVLQPILKAGFILLPVTAAVAVPLLVALPTLFIWAPAGSPQHTLYLNVPFFVLRSLGCFALWGVLAWRPKNPAATLILMALTLSFAAIDWIMSLEAPWSSSVFGLLVSIQWITGALAAAIMLAAPRASSAQRHALGTMLFTAVLLTAYLAFMQFLIIWEENLPNEIGWYARRFTAPWNIVLTSWILFGLVVPFLLLLRRRLKESARGVIAAAALALIGQALACWWLVLPAFSYSLDWTAPAALAAIGGLGAAVLLRWGTA